MTKSPSNFRSTATQLVSSVDKQLDGFGLMNVSKTEVSHRIRIKNRRKRYLDLHPEYFGGNLELADPLLYDRLVRRFQTSSEREAEGRKKGYSGILEADLLRSEAKVEALKNPASDNLFTYKRGQDGQIVAEDKDEVPFTKEEGLERWTDIMAQRFLRGRDDDFDYSTVDDNEIYDDVKMEDLEAQEAYFDEQTPEFVTADSQGIHGETGIQDF